MVLTCPYSALGEDIPKALAGGKPKHCGEVDFSVETLKKKYPEWYDLVEMAVKKADETNTEIDCWPLIKKLVPYFRINTKKSAVEIYDFIKSLECYETGVRFRNALEKESANFNIPDKYASYVGYFIKAILRGETIFGTSTIHEYQVDTDTPTIVFGPNINSVLTGGGGFDFLIGGDGDDILRGGREGLPDGDDNDVLIGGNGNDIYLFPSWGSTYVFEENTPEAGANVVRIGGDIKPEDLDFSIVVRALRIVHGPVIRTVESMKRSSIIISNWTPLYPEEVIDDPVSRRNWDLTKVADYPPIQRIEFSDGTVLGVQDILKIMESYKKVK